MRLVSILRAVAPHRQHERGLRVLLSLVRPSAVISAVVNDVSRGTVEGRLSRVLTCATRWVRHGSLSQRAAPEGPERTGLARSVRKHLPPVVAVDSSTVVSALHGACIRLVRSQAFIGATWVNAGGAQTSVFWGCSPGSHVPFPLEDRRDCRCWQPTNPTLAQCVRAHVTPNQPSILASGDLEGISANGGGAATHRARH